MKISSVQFIKSAPDIDRRPEKELPEIVVIGRSNVGKSSLINMLLNRPGMAKTSSMPGKTKLINYFEINEERYLVDFPGYGYAKKSKDSRVDWMDAMEEYLMENEHICDFLLLVNGHLPPQKNDLIMYEALVESKIKCTLVMTKCDKKMKQGVLKGHIAAWKKIIASYNQETPIYKTSGQTKLGREELLEHIGTKIAQSSMEE